MSGFKIHTIESAPEDSRGTLTNLVSEIGFLPNLAATMAESPALIEAFASLRRINRQRSSLTAIERELASIAVAFEYGCSYCVAAHSTFAIGAGASQLDVADVRTGKAPREPRMAALIAFTRRVARNTLGEMHGDTRDLLRAGFDRQQIFDVFSTAAQVALASQAFLLARPQLDAPFLSHAWEPPGLPEAERE
jgi:uncharacterized peroxidase-related enzyme